MYMKQYAKICTMKYLKSLRDLKLKCERKIKEILNWSSVLIIQLYLFFISPLLNKEFLCMHIIHNLQKNANYEEQRFCLALIFISCSDSLCIVLMKSIRLNEIKKWKQLVLFSEHILNNLSFLNEI